MSLPNRRSDPSICSSMPAAGSVFGQHEVHSVAVPERMESAFTHSIGAESSGSLFGQHISPAISPLHQCREVARMGKRSIFRNEIHMQGLAAD